MLVAEGAPALSLVVATRRDPPWALHRARLKGDVRELRASDLAFDEGETAELFSNASLDVPAVSLASLVARTEGWPAALQLAAIRMQQTADVATFVSEFSGSESTLSDYLLSELLLEQPADVLEVLTAVAEVGTVCPELADAIVHRKGAGARLRELAASNLLIEAGVGEAGWYRLPSLVRDVLHQELRDPARDAGFMRMPPAGTSRQERYSKRRWTTPSSVSSIGI